MIEILIDGKNVSHCVVTRSNIHHIAPISTHFFSGQGKGEMRTYWLIGKSHSCNVVIQEPREETVKESLDDFREFSESCLKETDFKKEKISSYDIKFRNSMINRHGRLHSLKQNDHKLDRFRRIKSCASNDKYPKGNKMRRYDNFLV